MSNLALQDLQKTWELLKSIAPRKVYYALSEYVEDDTKFYQVPFDKNTKELWIMHPRRFREFEFYAILNNYVLIDIRKEPIKLDLSPLLERY